MKKALVLLLLARTAAADPLDVFGFDARAKAMANAATATATNASAAFYNPAAGAFATDPQLQIGYSAAAMLLRINDRDAEVSSPRGVALGLGLPVRCGAACTFAFDLALYLPDQFITRIQTIPASEPHFVLLDNDVDRIVVNPTAALRIGRFAIGGGVTLLSDAAGNGIEFTVGATPGGKPVSEASLDVALPSRAAPLVGAMVEVFPGFRVGASYRGELDLRLRLDILAHVQVPGGGDTIISIRALNFYTPRKLSFGAAFDATDHLTLAADASYYNWANFAGGVPDLKILVDLMFAPTLLDGTFPADRLHDTMTVRAGGEWRTSVGTDREAALRAGVAYEPSPLPPQVLETSFADGDRVIVTGGAGVRWARIPGILEKPFGVDAAIEWHKLLGQTTQKVDPALPGFSTGGSMLHFALTATAAF